ncbi:uncharacterized protein LOC142329895 [Lycorma delicatula]|uniref:uncharacterized protein LOC142329895 n=1 Tax=Lycorma delicatula TaxID=130591 RepID=UPI003F513DF7
MHELFLTRLISLLEKNAIVDYNVYTKDRYFTLMNEIKNIKSKPIKELKDCIKLQKFDVVIENDIEKLVRPVGFSRYKYYTHEEELYDVINKIHVDLDHAEFPKVLTRFQLLYEAIPNEIIKLCLSVCEVCSLNNNEEREMNLQVVNKLHFANVDENIFNIKSENEVIDLIDSSDEEISTNNGSIGNVVHKKILSSVIDMSDYESSKELPYKRFQQTGIEIIKDKTDSETEICLRFKSFCSNMKSVVSSYLNNEQFVDVTLACEGEIIKCHKIILSANSPYFEKILCQNPRKHPTIFFKGISSWDVKALINFIYKGEVKVPRYKLESLLHAAEILQIRGLSIEPVLNKTVKNINLCENKNISKMPAYDKSNNDSNNGLKAKIYIKEDGSTSVAKKNI